MFIASAFQERLLSYTGQAATEVSASAFISHGRNEAGVPVLAPITLRLAIGPGALPERPPLVSCLMLTKHRFRQAKLAVGCFRRQTWPNRELIIIDQNADTQLAEWIERLDDPSIRHYPMPDTSEVLGSLRNRSLDLAAGFFVCVWDDDDLQHPARIEVAIAAMANSKTQASVLARQTIWIPAQGRIGVLALRPHENTLLAARAIMPRYSELARGEDTPVVEALVTARQLVLVNLPELYVYVAHGNNTWDASHMDAMWQYASDRKEGAAAKSMLALLQRAFPVSEYSAALRARDADQSRRDKRRVGHRKVR